MRFLLRLILGLVVLLVLALGLLRGAAGLRETADRNAALPPEGRLVETALGRIYVEEAGPQDGPVVLLIHGSVGWSRLWAGTQAALAAEGWRSIAPDLPPMGFSDRHPAADYSRQRQAERLRALIEALGVRPVVVAHSFGAGPAAEALMQDPGAFAGLVVVSGAIGLGRDGAGARLPLPLRAGWLREVAVAASVTNPWVNRPLLRLFLHRKETATEEIAAVLRRPMALRGTTPALAGWMPTLMLPPVGALSSTPEGWQGLAGRVAFVWGDRDTTTPLAQGQALAALTGGPLIVLGEVGHIPQIEDPAGFHAALIRALSGLATGAPAP